MNEIQAIEEIKKLVNEELIELNLKLDPYNAGKKRAYINIYRILEELQKSNYKKSLRIKED